MYTSLVHILVKNTHKKSKDNFCEKYSSVFAWALQMRLKPVFKNVWKEVFRVYLYMYTHMYIFSHSDSQGALNTFGPLVVKLSTHPQICGPKKHLYTDVSINTLECENHETVDGLGTKASMNWLDHSHSVVELDIMSQFMFNSRRLKKRPLNRNSYWTLTRENMILWGTIWRSWTKFIMMNTDSAQNIGNIYHTKACEWSICKVKNKRCI